MSRRRIKRSRRFAFSSDEEEEQKQDFKEPPHTTILLLGRSGTGKTVFCRALLAEFKQFNKKVAILNFKPTKKTPTTPHKIIDWKDLSGPPPLQDIALLVEDIIKLQKWQVNALTLLINYQVHHNRLSPTIFLSQQIYCQGLYSLLGGFTRIYVTAAKANIRTWVQLLQYFGFDKQERTTHLRAFRTCKIPNSLFFLEVETLEITRIDAPFLPDIGYGTAADEGDENRNTQKTSKKMSGRDTLALSKAQRYLSVLSNPREALALFDLLYYKLSKSSIDPESLEITLQQKGSSRPVFVSLIDYIGHLVDAKQKVVPSRLIKKFHSYTQKVRGISLPRHFVLNTAFH